MRNSKRRIFLRLEALSTRVGALKSKFKKIVKNWKEVNQVETNVIEKLTWKAIFRHNHQIFLDIIDIYPVVWQFWYCKIFCQNLRNIQQRLEPESVTYAGWGNNFHLKLLSKYCTMTTLCKITLWVSGKFFFDNFSVFF